MVNSILRIRSISILALFLSALCLQAQTGSLSSKLLQAMELESELGGPMINESVPAANSINPDYYYLGPGDVLAMLIIPQNSKEIEVPVYPDNTIIIPKLNIGMDVKGMTLTELREKIEVEATSKNASSKVFISLRKPKQCVITVKGNVEAPGVYTLPGTMSVSSILRIGNKLETKTGFSPLEQQQEYFETNENKAKTKRFETFGVSPDKAYWRRNVSVLHSDGSSDYLDLELGRSLDDPTENPYIMPGDVITVPYNKSSYPTISIYGEVIRPIELPYKSYDDIKNLWAFGGGATEHADLSNVVYHSPTGNERILKIGDGGELLEDFMIEAGSSIIVPEETEPTVDRKPIVAIKGEVQKPGYYSVDASTGLDELIAKAGGLTARAYVPLGYINRRNSEDETYDQRQAYLESFLNSDLTLEDTLRYNIDFLTKKPIVAVDFVKAAQGDVEVDFVDGDVVVIPQNPKRVYVFGRVNQPGLVKFEQGADVWDYIESAGGMTEMAVEDRIRIIRGNTNVWLNPEENPEIFAGDQIYVAGEPDVPLLAEQQQNQLYVNIGGVLVGLANLLFFIFNAQ